MRERQTFRVLKNKVLRKIFGAKRDEIAGECRKLQKYVTRMEQFRNMYRVLVVRSKGKRPFGRPRYRWEDNMKMNLRDVGCSAGDRIDLAKYGDKLQANVRAYYFM